MQTSESTVSLIFGLVDAQRSPKTGAKAANLSKLIAARFAVPRGFAVSADAYRGHLWASGARDLASRASEAEDREQVRQAILSTEIPDGIWQPIAQAYERLALQLGVQEPKVSVRSSAIEKDFAAGGFPGAYESFLNVTGPAALAEAVKRVWASAWGGKAAAYRARFGVESEPAMAVIVQQMVREGCSGSATSANPVTGDPHRIDIACYSHEGSAQYAVDLRDVSVLQRSEPGRAVMEDRAIRFVAEQAVLIEEAIGSPADIDWVLAQGRLWVLQVRPIDDLPSRFPLPDDFSADEQTCWRRVTDRPASFFARSRNESAQVRILNGYVYVRENSEPDSGLAGGGRIGREARASAKLLAQWNDELEPVVTAYARRIIGSDLESMEYGQLLRAVSKASDNAGRAMEWFERLARLCATLTRLLDAQITAASGNPGLTERLLAGLQDTTILRDARLQELGERFLIAQDSGRLGDEAWRRNYKREVDQFARDYGYSFKDPGEMYDIASWRSWPEDPDPVFRMIGALKRQDKRPTIITRHCAAEQIAHEAAAELREMLNGRSRGQLFKGIELVRRLMASGAQAEGAFALASTALRLVVAELGQRLSGIGAIDQADDVYQLTIDELTALPERLDRTDTTRISRILAERRHTLWLESRYRAPVALPASGMATSGAMTGRRLRGLAVSPGVAVGRAKIAREIHEAGEIECGDILVVGTSRLAWTPFLGVAGGLVAEDSSDCSTAAALAREYGVPVVVDCIGVMSTVTDGQRITVNGDEGTVEVR